MLAHICHQPDSFLCHKIWLRHRLLQEVSADCPAHPGFFPLVCCTSPKEAARLPPPLNWQGLRGRDQTLRILALPESHTVASQSSPRERSASESGLRAAPASEASSLSVYWGTRLTEQNHTSAGGMEVPGWGSAQQGNGSLGGLTPSPHLLGIAGSC